MKKIFVFAFAFAALFMGVSCTQDNLRDDSASEAPATVERVPVTIRAGFGDSVLSRTYLDGYTVKWSASDEIGIIDELWETGIDKASAIQTFTISDRSADNTTATFTGSLRPGLANYYATYPYSADNFVDKAAGYIRSGFKSAQNASAPSTFNDSFNPAVALLKDGALSFKNIGGLLKFTLTENTVKSVVITANDGGTVGGVYYIQLDANGDIDEATLASARTSITFTPSASETFAVGDYYVAVSARTYTGGLVLKLTLSDNSIVYRSTTSDVVVERSKITNLGNITPSAPGAVTFPVVFNLGYPTESPAANSDSYNASGKIQVTEWTTAALYGSTNASTAAGTYGKWHSRTQPEAYMTYTWDSKITSTEVAHFLELANTYSYKIGTVGIKGVWTDDFFEFTLPVKNFAAGTTLKLTMPLYTRNGPTFWEVKYYDGGVWKTTATANLPAYTGSATTATATWAVPFGGVAKSTTVNTLQTVDMTFANAIASGLVKVRVICVDGSTISTAANTVETGRSAPYTPVGSAPFYFWNPADKDNQAVTFAIVP